MALAPKKLSDLDDAGALVDNDRMLIGRAPIGAKITWGDFKAILRSMFANPMLPVGDWDLTPVPAPAVLGAGDNRAPFSAPFDVSGNALRTKVTAPGLIYNNAKFPNVIANEGEHWVIFKPDFSAVNSPTIAMAGAAITPDLYGALTAGGPGVQIVYFPGQGLVASSGGLTQVVDAAFMPPQSFLVTINGANGLIHVQTDAVDVTLPYNAPAASYVSAVNGLYSSDNNTHTLVMQASTDAGTLYGRTLRPESVPLGGVGPAPMPAGAVNGNRFAISAPGFLLRPDSTRIDIPARAVVELKIAGDVVDYIVEMNWALADLAAMVSSTGLVYQGDFSLLWPQVTSDGLYTCSKPATFKQADYTNNDLRRYVPAGSVLLVRNGVPSVIAADMAYEHARLPSANFGNRDFDSYGLMTSVTWWRSAWPAMNPNWGQTGALSEGQFEFTAQQPQAISAGGPAEYVLGICLPQLDANGTQVYFTSYQDAELPLGACFVWLDFVAQQCWMNNNLDGTTRKTLLADNLDIGTVARDDTYDFYVGSDDMGLRPIRVYKNGKPIYDPITAALGGDFIGFNGPRPGYVPFGRLNGFNGAQFSCNTGRKPFKYTSTGADSATVAPVPLLPDASLQGMASAEEVNALQTALTTETNRASGADAQLLYMTDRVVCINKGRVYTNDDWTAFLQGQAGDVVMVGYGHTISTDYLNGAYALEGTIFKRLASGGFALVAASRIGGDMGRVVLYNAVYGPAVVGLILVANFGNPASPLDAVFPDIAATGWSVVAASNNLDRQVITKTLTANTAAIPEVPNGYPFRFTLVVRQDEEGGRALTWPAGWLFAGGARPVITAAAGAVDVFEVAPAGDGSFLVSALAQNLS